MECGRVASVKRPRLTHQGDKKHAHGHGYHDDGQGPKTGVVGVVLGGFLSSLFLDDAILAGLPTNRMAVVGRTGSLSRIRRPRCVVGVLERVELVRQFVLSEAGLLLVGCVHLEVFAIWGQLVEMSHGV